MGILVLGAIAPPPDPTQARVNPEAQPLQLLGMGRVVKAPPLDPVNLPQRVASATLDIALYTPGTSCAGFLPTVLTVPADRPVTAVVRHVLTDPNLALIGFDLSGYRVLEDAPKGEVIVDFRLPPQSPRQLASLSMCEQQIVLGSVRKTLLDNPALAISSVQFTERGRPLQL
ncbi:MAG: sporulation/spore germination protein [Cyanobacteria bacterium]|nr:sporulation/spore germination protein [Cyanobacteriota bacterium]MDA0865691.1 sporulation/spore germination protein [Cyanobacteriota bacterium]